MMQRVSASRQTMSAEHMNHEVGDSTLPRLDFLNVGDSESFADTSKYVQSRPTLSNVDRGPVKEESEWSAIDDESSAESCVIVAENSAAASVGLPLAYECGEVDRDASMIMNGFDGIEIQFGAQFEGADTENHRMTIELEKDIDADMAEAASE